MIDNGKIVAQSIVIEFVDGSDTSIVRADLLELMIGIYAAGEDQTNDTELKCVIAFREWLHKTHNIVVTLTQAHTIYLTVWDRYQEFKKKLEGSLKSVGSSTSRSTTLTIE